MDDHLHEEGSFAQAYGWEEDNNMGQAEGVGQEHLADEAVPVPQKAVTHTPVLCFNKPRTHSLFAPPEIYALGICCITCLSLLQIAVHEQTDKL